MQLSQWDNSCLGALKQHLPSQHPVHPHFLYLKHLLVKTSNSRTDFPCRIQSTVFFNNIYLIHCQPLFTRHFLLQHIWTRSPEIFLCVLKKVMDTAKKLHALSFCNTFYNSHLMDMYQQPVCNAHMYSFRHYCYILLHLWHWLELQRSPQCLAEIH